jgi:hypothetical protein
LTSRSSVSFDGGVAPHHGSPTSAMEPAGQDLGARMRSGLTTVPLQSQPNASPFWIMLLLSSTAFGHGMIDADRTPGSQPTQTHSFVRRSTALSNFGSSNHHSWFPICPSDGSCEEHFALRHAVQFAEPVGLQPISQDPKQQVAGQLRGRSPPEHRVPSGSQVPASRRAGARSRCRGRLYPKFEKLLRFGSAIYNFSTQCARADFPELCAGSCAAACL